MTYGHTIGSVFARVHVEPFPGGFNLLDHGCHVATLTRTEAVDLLSILALKLDERTPHIPRPPLWMRARDWWLAKFPSKARRESEEAGRARAQRLMDGAGPKSRVLPQ